MPKPVDLLLTQLEAAKSRFGPDAAAETAALLEQLSNFHITDAKSLLRFHETLLFLRAFPQSISLVEQTEKLLNSFHARIENLHALGANMSVFDDFDTSGIAGTTMQDTLNFEAARWLARRLPRNVEVSWEEYEDDFLAERSRGSTWRRFIPLLEEDADVEANIPWRRWLNVARGRERDLDFLVRCIERLPGSDHKRAELYDSLRIPLRWRLDNLKLSRTRNWGRPRRLYIHRDPLIARSQVSLAREFAKPAPRLTKLSFRDGEKIMNLIKEVMLVRYRELYGTTLGDPRSVVRAEFGSLPESRGIVIYLWNLPPDRRLPLRAYVAGFTLKNGVPINYIEAIGLCEWIEVGFNTFYTYRQGETAWIYAQALRCLHAFTGATTISIYPYQIGQNNDEALDSGAFWFYRKLGFRCGRSDLEQLARREERKITADAQYRTPRRTLKRLAEAHMFRELETGAPTNGMPHVSPPLRDVGTEAARALRWRSASGATKKPLLEQRALTPEGPWPWDTFSTRNLALRVNHRMASDFSGDAERIRSASLQYVTRALRVNPSRWNSAELHALSNWSLVLAMIPDLVHWSSKEKKRMQELIRAQAGTNEMRYLHLTQTHPRLRHALLEMGSLTQR